MHGTKTFRLILGLLIGAALLFGVSRFLNLAATLEEFHEYPWSQLVAVLLLSLGYYLLKALRWHYILNVIGIKLPARRSFLLYLAGQWFAFTPAGEFVRAYLLKGYGFSLSRGTAAVTIQVVFDFLSLAIIGSVSVFWFHEQAILVLPFTGVLLLAIGAFVYAPLIKRGSPPSFLAAPGRLFGKQWSTFYHYARELLEWKSLLVGLSLGLVTVMVGALVLLQVSQGYEIRVGLGQATYIYSLSQLAGALSMLPHGLGAIEGTAVALFYYAGVDTAHATSAVVLFRLCTVGWGLIIGGISLLLLRTPLAGPPLHELERPAIVTSNPSL